MKPAIFGVAVLLALLTAVPAQAQTAADAAEIDVTWANIPPLFYGFVDLNHEWANAASADGVNVGGGSVAYTSYFMADDRYLYAAFVTNDPGLENHDRVGLFFDNDHNGAWPADCEVEGGYWIEYLTTGVENTFEPWSASGVCPTTPAPAVYSHTVMADGHVVTQFRVDLWHSEMRGAPGASIGAATTYEDGLGDAAVWPGGSNHADPATFGILKYPPEANSGFEAGWAYQAPTIDGDISPAEWNGATLIPVAGDLEATLKVLADADNLYLAYDILGDPALEEGDNVGLLFDNNNDGVWPVECADEGEIWVTYSANGNDYEFRPHAQSTGCSGNTITSVTAAFGLTTTGHVQVEMQLALNAGNITGGPGVTIGVQSYWGDLDADVAQWWPYRWTDDPSPFAKMRFPVCDGCYIDQRCYHDGAPNPNHVCQTCSKAQSTTDWSTAADDTACTDDGLFCDGAETCQAGVCTSAGDPCSADETCDETADACVTNADDDTTLDDDTTADDDVIADDDASPHANANGSSGGGCGC